MAAPWVLLGRFAALLGADDEEAEEHAPAFSFVLRAPPRVTFLTAARRVHPDPGGYIDPEPWILAAGRAGTLLRFALGPGDGADVDRVLVVARNFVRAAEGDPRAATTGSAELIPRRAAPMPVTYGPGRVGMVPLNDGHAYLIAELSRTDITSAKLLVFYSGGDEWVERDMAIPMPAQGREWTLVDVISHGNRLWWVDPSWGLLSCSPFDPAPELLVHYLPPDSLLENFHAGLPNERCVCKSDTMLLFAEITRGRGSEAAAVSVWRRIPHPDGSGETAMWDKLYEMSFAEIWNDDSYKATQLPARVPGIVLVSPSDFHLVYFVLEKRTFGVRVPDHQVVEFVADPAPPLQWVSSITVLPWILPPTISDDIVEETETFQERCGSTRANSGEEQST